MLERLAPLLMLNFAARAACSGQSSAEQEGLPAAGVVLREDGHQPSMVRRAKPKTALVSEALCPSGWAESPQNAGSPLWLQSYDAREISSVASFDDNTLQTDGTAAFVVKLDADGNVAYARALGQAVDGAIDSQPNGQISCAESWATLVEGRPVLSCWTV